MSLACLTCQVVQRTDSDLRSYSFNSQQEQRCGAVVGCWSTKNPRQPPLEEVSARVVPVLSNSNSNNNQGPVSPRLTRCHAVRRDILRDWNFEEFAEGSRACLS
uniref:Uncharacterized protein n=1 Tax=Picea sitchensis TaxID=3332 RepID=A9NN46_PICSI|nr:unknown [Picea sitchensis]